MQTKAVQKNVVRRTFVISS